MPLVIYHDISGRRLEVEVPAGDTLMEGAVDNGVSGIVAECGGACACATCHAYVAEEWLPRLRPMDEMEEAMLDAASGRQPNSRLTCQIEMAPALHGIEVFIAPNGNP